MAQFVVSFTFLTKRFSIGIAPWGPKSYCMIHKSFEFTNQVNLKLCHLVRKDQLLINITSRGPTFDLLMLGGMDQRASISLEACWASNRHHLILCSVPDEKLLVSGKAYRI